MDEEIDLRLVLTNSPPLNGRPVKLRCREHDDRLASLSVYPDGIYCFGCRFGIQRNRLEALEYLKRNFEGTLEGNYTTKKEGSSTRRKTTEGYLPSALAEAYHNYLYQSRKERLEWLHNRTLTDQAIQRFQIGHNGTHFTIPLFDTSGCLVSIRLRRDDCYLDVEESKYAGTTGRNQPMLYPEWLQGDAREWRVVTESELCAVRLWQDDVPTVTVTNGARNLIKLIELLSPYSHVKDLYIASDLDRAGNTAYADLQRSQSRFVIRSIDWQRSLGKDVTEVYQSGFGQKIFGWYKDKKRLRLMG